LAKKSIIIIGAGLAGLSAGCYAQMNGYSSRIFEHASKPGGVAAWWKRGDYLIDGGIHFLMAHRPGSSTYDLYRELGAAQENKFPTMTSYLRFVDEASRMKVDITSDLGRLASDLTKISPVDAGAIRKFITEVSKLRNSSLLSIMLSEAGMGAALELKRPLDTMKALWSMRGFLKYSYLFVGRFSKSIAAYARNLHSPLLGKIFENLFLPELPVWFIIMILAMATGGHLGLLERGCPGFILPIERRYRTLGGEITYNSTVEKVLVKEGSAVGVRLVDGTEHQADAVISAADGYSTIFKMLDGQYLNSKIKRQYESWEMSRPFAVVSFGVAREFRDEPHISIFILKRPLKVGAQNVSSLTLRIFNYGDKFAPNGKTVIQAIIETEWDYWNKLHGNSPRYEAEKNRLARDILSRLEDHYPGLSSQVEVTDIATPFTSWRYNLNHKGSSMGWLMTPKTIMAQIPNALPGLKNFCMAGQWVLSGGSVPGSIYSGRRVVQILCRQDRKPFRSSLP
jgi:phytoene desaturase